MSLSSASSARFARPRRARRSGGRRRGRGRREFAGEPLVERARANRLDQPAVETAERDRAEGAPFERREQHQRLRRAGGARGAGEAVGRFDAERAVDDDEVGAVAARQRGEAVVEPFGAHDRHARLDQPGGDRRRLERRTGDDQRAAADERLRRRLRPARSTAAGSATAKAKIEPPPGLSASVSSPPISATMRLAMARPSPAPS